MSLSRTFATANAPESGKRGLLPRRVRALSLLRWAARNRVSVLCVQESGTYLSAAVSRVVLKRTAKAKPRQGRRWGRFYAPATAHGAGGRRRGNGVVWNRRHWRLVATRVVGVPWHDSPTGALYIPVVVLAYRRGGQQVVVASVHAPIKRADPRGGTRRAINAKVRELARDCEAMGVPLVVGGDFNDGNVRPDVRGSGLKTAAHHGVDWLLTTGKASDDRTHDLKRARLSDHHAVSARITF